MSSQAKKGGEAEAEASAEHPESTPQQSTPESNLDQQEASTEAETPQAPQTDVEETAELEKLRAQISELEAENSELKDRYLRKQADFENFRKRSIREREETVAYSNQQLLNDLVTVIDDFERAVKSAEESRDFDSFHNGIVLIEKQLTSMLERKWGLKRFDSEGEEFDPQRHEAVLSEPSEEFEHPTVLEDLQKGYFLNDRVLRSAKVKVAMPS
ncbi:MAG: nucleotide exchange factor GrpE [Spirochaetaceae bacterium]|nr:MAG: nucleotide exchange factor GrpE [Spirochaetaceae bacterium]